MVDKRLIAYDGSNTTAADLNWDWVTTIELAENAYETSVTVENVSGYIDFLNTGAGDGVYYAIIGITDGAGSYPFDGTTMAAEAETSAELRDFLDKNRKNIFMTRGGLVGSSEEADKTSIELDAATKRVLKKGQKMYLCIGFRSLTGGVFTCYYFADMTVFYS